MNARFVMAQLGRVVQLLGAVLSAIAVLFVLVPGRDMTFFDVGEQCLLITGVGALALGTMGWRAGRAACTVRTRGLDDDVLERPYRMSRRDAAVLTTGAWVVGSLIAAVPFMAWAHFAPDMPASHPFNSAINCLFEATSGLTTTGATILPDIESLPRSLLFWRSIIQWLGGLGILVLFVAVLPGLGIGAKRLFRLEAPGPSPEGPRPSVREASRRLWQLYLGLTLTLFVLLMSGGMGWFEAANHTFTTMATSGFSTWNSSVGHADSMFIQVVIVIFMVIAASNFGVLWALLKGQWRAALRDTEFKVFLSLLLLGTTLCAIALVTAGEPIVLTNGQEVAPTPGRALGEAAFTVVSQQTTTGYATADWDLWPLAAKAMIVLLMFVGGSAGSTAGGVKVVRIWIAARVLIREVERFFRPDVVRPLRLNGQSIDARQQMQTVVFVGGMLAMLAMGTMALLAIESSRTGISFATAASASLATVCTVGPGIDAVGATCNYEWFSDASKLLLCGLMLVGRLEFFVVLVLFHPRFWRSQ